MTDKIVLGTVQLGTEYGVANKTGMPSNDEAFRILSSAYDAGVRELDTASAYGQSEYVIGKFIGSAQKHFDAVSKTRLFGDGGIGGFRAGFEKTLGALGQDSLYGYLVHDFTDFRKYGTGLWDECLRLKKEGLVKNAGFSVYHPGELDYLFEKKVTPDIVQLPFNVFDQRFKPRFAGLKERGIKIYARSAFLQGLFFLTPEESGKKCRNAPGRIAELKKVSDEHGMPLAALCELFALLEEGIDKVVIGVDSVRQLEENLSFLKYAEKGRRLRGALGEMAVEDEDVILPYRWSK